MLKKLLIIALLATANPCSATIKKGIFWGSTAVATACGLASAEKIWWMSKRVRIDQAIVQTTRTQTNKELLFRYACATAISGATAWYYKDARNEKSPEAST